MGLLPPRGIRQRVGVGFILLACLIVDAVAIVGHPSWATDDDEPLPLEVRHLNASLADGAVTYDPWSELEYLDVTETYHLPATEVSASFGAGNTFETWRYATKLEVEYLWRHAGVQDIGSGLASTANVSAVLALQDKVGFWYRSDGRFQGNPRRYRVTAAFVDDFTNHQPSKGTFYSGDLNRAALTGPMQRTVAELRVDVLTNVSITRFYSRSSTDHMFGSWLVRTPTELFPSVFHARINGESTCGNLCTSDMCSPPVNAAGKGSATIPITP